MEVISVVASGIKLGRTLQLVLLVLLSPSFQWRYWLYFCWSIVYRLYALVDADFGGSVGLGGLLGMDWTVYGVVAPVLWV
jgi:hypothetical protein